MKYAGYVKWRAIHDIRWHIDISQIADACLLVLSVGILLPLLACTVVWNGFSWLVAKVRKKPYLHPLVHYNGYATRGLPPTHPLVRRMDAQNRPFAQRIGHVE